MLILETERLLLRTIEEKDAPFYFNLVNSAPFLTNIGDKGVRNLADARAGIASGPVAMQAARGHSLYLVELKASGVAIGMSGLIKRDALDDVDLGYAFLPPYFGQGYGYEAAVAVRDHARAVLGMQRLVAITSPENAASNGLLEKIGMRFEKMIQMTPEDSGTRLYGMDLRATF
ncbi:GNAT family N-acetyltransferase [Massilia sp. CF038]|uniref:GNAT family N-acetyltransferase n=1 Tax=Massilia sp. CF038 TaxID=1881045 RepID=UPI0009153FF1|nr:GNAT family N-acetyltransferase [Massilia sp. CF038]SHG41207.1 Protein N-acetyltransferase, RimJ/RimL family [Massilia sp. CF038]